MLIFQGFVICAIETFGTCIFVMKIPSITHPYMVILLTNCVFIMPAGVALYNAIFRRSNQSTQSVSPIKKSVFFGIAFFLELTGIGLTVTLWTVTKHSTALENIWYPVAGIVCLSIAWVPEIQSFLLKENHADKTYAANESNSVNNGDQNQEDVGQSSAVNRHSQQELSDGGNREHDATNGDQNQEDVGQSSAVNQNSQQELSDGGNREHDATNGDQNQEDVGQSSAVNQNSQQELSDGGNREHDATNGDQNQEDVGQSSAVNQNSQQKLSDGGNREHDATNGGQTQEDVGQSSAVNQNSQQKLSDGGNREQDATNGDQNQKDVGQSSAVNQNSQQELSDGGNREHDATNGDQNQEDVGQSSAVNQNSQQELSDGGNREHDATNGDQNQEDVGQSSAVNQNSQQELSDGGNREHDATNGDQNQEDVGQSSAVNQNSQQELSDGGNREHDATNGDQNQEDVGQSSAVNQNSQQERSDRGNREYVVVSLENQRETSENGNCALQKPTWKMVIYMSFLKIVFTFVFSFILLRFAIFDSSVDATAVSEHFKSGWYGWEGFEIYYFIANGCSSLLGYVIGFIACTTCMQKGAYAMPLFLATPLAAVLYSAYESCVWILHHGDTGDMCLLEGKMNMLLLVGACSCLVFAQYFSFGYFIIKSRPLVKQDEAQVSFLVNCRQASS